MSKPMTTEQMAYAALTDYNTPPKWPDPERWECPSCGRTLYDQTHHRRHAVTCSLLREDARDSFARIDGEET